MNQINLHQYNKYLKLELRDKKKYVYDPVRNKYVFLSPEEFVRQLYLQYLWIEKGLSKRLIQVEKEFKLGKQRKRYDIVCFNNKTEPFLLVECKSFKVDLDESAYKQVSVYNLELKIPFLALCNGRELQYVKINFENGDYEFVDDISWPH